MSYYKNKTVIITGASRGIGLSIGVRLAREGANIAIFAKTDSAHPKLPGTIYIAAEEIERAGGKAFPYKVDIRDEETVKIAIEKTVETFGGVDILINNASAISLTDTINTDMKKFDLMHQINTRGTFLVSKYCIPYLTKSKNAHILNISPPLSMDPKWFKNHVAYTIAKYGMSMCVLGMSEELRASNIAVNALWPRTLIATSAVNNLLGGEKIMQHARNSDIVADAAFFILQKNASLFTGNFCIDEEILKENSITDFTPYAINPAKNLMTDLFL